MDDFMKLHENAFPFEPEWLIFANQMKMVLGRDILILEIIWLGKNRSSIFWGFFSWKKKNNIFKWTWYKSGIS